MPTSTKAFIAANGGPLSLAVIGIGLGGYTNRWLGGALLAIGVGWFLLAHVRFPVVWIGFSGPTPIQERDALRRRVLLRNDLQQCLASLRAMPDPSPAELRALAANLADRLRNDGFPIVANLAEVHLLDSASPEEIKNRKETVDLLLMQLLLNENYR